MEYLYENGINAVVPDTNFRQRDARIATSERVKKHKTIRQKTRKDQGKNTAKIPASEFSFNEAAKKCVCPSEQGRKDYAKRMWTIEPVFGNITSNKGINKLTLRGKAKVTAQWTICCIMHNIEKLWRYGDLHQYA